MFLREAGTRMKGQCSHSRSYTSCPSPSPLAWCGRFSGCSCSHSCQALRTRGPRGSRSCRWDRKSWLGHCSSLELRMNRRDSPGTVFHVFHSTPVHQDSYLVLVLLLGMESPPVTLTVPLVILLLSTGVCRQEPAQQPQPKEWLRIWLRLWLWETIH